MEIFKNPQSLHSKSQNPFKLKFPLVLGTQVSYWNLFEHLSIHFNWGPPFLWHNSCWKQFQNDKAGCSSIFPSASSHWFSGLFIQIQVKSCHSFLICYFEPFYTWWTKWHKRHLECMVTIQKTPSLMDVAPWIAHWILMVSDGIRWYCMFFGGILLLVFNGLTWSDLVTNLRKKEFSD